ncbi:uncharacterized protein I206_100295 [Kwoniella pini CBS 10737]|uniref:MARVEL domain-containing protein n=1 Tax=Kwoniella pini CBS 10737 TaxID=1296096 RepID=A0A1B9IE71_9TREE|nr:uncharacterized protein I206_01030 [Kwoniella pini CBS 10737]OCF53724.1 hypothetical protein I206_01030 [Kwoniella pini CBS 10737]
MAKAARAPGSESQTSRPKFSFKNVFSTGRQTFWAVFFILWFCIDVAELGLVSQQLHKYGNQTISYPTGEYYHALGLLLFSTIIGLLFCLFHWAVGLTLYLPIFLAFGVWWGTGAGILYGTPFGHGLQCKHTSDPSRFPANWVPFLGECSRVTAIEGLAWALFALSVIGLFYTFLDKFSFHSKRSSVYDKAEEGHAQIPEKH